MDVDALVMSVGVRHKVYATGSETFTTPINGVRITAITFPTAEQAATFAAACMGDGVPAMECGLIEGEFAVVVLH